MTKTSLQREASMQMSESLGPGDCQFPYSKLDLLNCQLYGSNAPANLKTFEMEIDSAEVAAT